MAGEMNYSLADLRAAMGDGDGLFSGNNGLLILLFFWMMSGRGGFGNCQEVISKATSDVATKAQIENLAATINTDSIKECLAHNESAIEALSKQLCCSTSDIIAAVNAVNVSQLQGQAHIEQLINTCCCNLRTELLQGFGAVDKSICGLNNSLIQGFGALNTSVERAASSINFESEKNYQALSAQIDRNHTAQLINNDKNTDRVIQFMTEQNIAALRDRAAKAEVELSQRDQSAYILSQLKNGCGCNPCGGCC